MPSKKVSSVEPGEHREHQEREQETGQHREYVDRHHRRGMRQRKGRDKDNEPQECEQDIDPVQVHRDYLERHLRGGAAATSEAYARAIEQWHHLPGAVITPGTDLSHAQAASKKTALAESTSDPVSKEQHS